MVFSRCDELALCFNIFLNCFHISITSRTKQNIRLTNWLWNYKIMQNGRRITLETKNGSTKSQLMLNQNG